MVCKVTLSSQVNPNLVRDLIVVFLWVWNHFCLFLCQGMPFFFLLWNVENFCDSPVERVFGKKCKNSGLSYFLWVYFKLLFFFFVGDAYFLFLSLVLLLGELCYCKLCFNLFFVWSCSSMSIFVLLKKGSWWFLSCCFSGYILL